MNKHRLTDSSTLASTQPTPVTLDAERSAQGSSMLAVLIIIAHQKKLILWVTLGFAVVACFVSFIIPAQYKATVVVLPPQQSSSITSMLGEMGGLGSLAGLANSAFGSKNLDDMYVAMLKSESVENAVIQKYGLLGEYDKKYYFDARKKLEWRTTIDGSKKDGMIRLTFEDHNPARAAEIANGYIEILRSLSQHLAITEAAQRRMVFEQQLQKAKDDLADSEDALKKTQLSTGFVQIDAQSRAMIESAATLRAQMVAKQVQIQAMQAYAGQGNPDLQEQEDELAGLRRQFNQMVGSNGSSTDDLFLSKGNVPEAALEYARRVRDVKYNEAVFELLARQLEAAKIDEAREGGFLQIVNPALLPERRSFPRRTLLTIGAAVFGFSIATMLSLIHSRVAQMQTDPIHAKQIEQLKRAIWLRTESTNELGGDIGTSPVAPDSSTAQGVNHFHDVLRQ